MKVSAISYPYNQQNYSQTTRNKGLQVSRPQSNALPRVFYPPVNISFGLENARSLKKLFSYGLPCMYTGIEMIDPAKVQKFISKGLHNIPAVEVCKWIDSVYDSLLSNEKEVYQMIREQAQFEPEKNLQEVLQSLNKKHERELLKAQVPIFKTLVSYSYALPASMQEKVLQLLADTEDKINQKPIMSSFSVTEFSYKLEKIKSDVAKLHDKKSLGVVNHLIKLTKSFAPKTTDKNMYEQRKIISEMEGFVKRSVLNDNSALNDLLANSKAKLNDEKILVPFSRKVFLYDLSQIIKDLDNSELKEIFMKIAEKLPTSRENDAAYIAKLSKESSDKIFYRLLWPSIATVEHILPRSCMGANAMSNYGGACARENSERHNLTFIEQMQRRPDTAKNCQKYVDRLIQYAKAGIFEKENIDVRYIEDFKNAIAVQSEGAIILDTSKLYEDGRFPKPESAYFEKSSLTV